MGEPRLTESQWQVLGALVRLVPDRDSVPASAREVSHRCGWAHLRHVWAYPRLKALERKGLAQTQTHGRRPYWTPTDAGRAALAQEPCE